MRVSVTAASKYVRNRRTDIDGRIIEKPYMEVSLFISIVNPHKLHAVDKNLSKLW
jgi:hypothetical protein